MSTGTFLQVFCRFCGHRGVPTVVISDNVKTFQARSKEIQKVVRSEPVQQYLANWKISWKFIIEKAPWWGGFWESLVQSVKRCLKKTIGRASLTFDKLVTIMVEIESTINNRPLTYIYDDTEGINQPLTSADLIYGHRIATSPSNRQFEITSTAKTLTK